MFPKWCLSSKKEAAETGCALQAWVWKSQNFTLSSSVNQEVTGLPRCRGGKSIPPLDGSSHMSVQRWRSWGCLRRPAPRAASLLLCTPGRNPPMASRVVKAKVLSRLQADLFICFLSAVCLSSPGCRFLVGRHFYPFVACCPQCPAWCRARRKNSTNVC